MAKKTMDDFYKESYEFWQQQALKTGDDLLKLQEQVAQMIIKFTELKNESKRSRGINPETNETDERANDERLNKIVDEDIYLNGIISEVHRGRFVSIRQSKSDSLSIYFANYNNHIADKTYKPMYESLSPESFVLISEAMNQAIERFGIDRKKAIESLTGKGNIEFVNAITPY